MKEGRGSRSRREMGGKVGARVGKGNQWGRAIGAMGGRFVSTSNDKCQNSVVMQAFDAGRGACIWSHSLLNPKLHLTLTNPGTDSSHDRSSVCVLHTGLASWRGGLEEGSHDGPLLHNCNPSLSFPSTSMITSHFFLLCLFLYKYLFRAPVIRSPERRSSRRPLISDLLI